MKFIALLFTLATTLLLNVRADYVTGFVTVSIKNTPPIIRSVTISNNTSDNSLECEVDFFDENPDNVTINYTWQLNDGVVSHGRTLTPGRNGEYLCVVRISDDNGAVSELSSKRFVINKENGMFNAVTGNAVLPLGKSRRGLGIITLLILLSLFLLLFLPSHAPLLKKQ